ncbi:hypothetical protein KJZ61_02215 [Candidatus Dependentiae bacterium]|nr:hypothetical protein [Candidatus Dependentiae bacterium]
MKKIGLLISIILAINPPSILKAVHTTPAINDHQNSATIKAQQERIFIDLLRNFVNFCMERFDFVQETIKRSNTDEPISFTQEIEPFNDRTQKERETLLTDILPQLPAQPSLQFFLDVRNMGIELYQHCFLSQKLIKQENDTLISFRVLTLILQKLYDQLDQHDKDAIQENFSEESDAYLKHLQEFPLTIQKLLQEQKGSSKLVLDEEECKILHEVIKKFRRETINDDRFCISVGQSLAYQTLVNQLVQPQKTDHYLLFPFSKGIMLDPLPQDLDPEIIKNYYASETRITNLDAVTELERKIFGTVVDKIQLNNRPIILCDQIEQMGGIGRLVNFISNNQAEQLDAHYCFQTYSHDTPCTVTDFQRNPLFLKLREKNVVTLFNTIPASCSEKIRLNSKLTAEGQETFRMCPVMSPELFLFGIPAIAQHGFRPHSQAIILLGNYLDYYSAHQLPEQESDSYCAKIKRLYPRSYQMVRTFLNKLFYRDATYKQCSFDAQIIEKSK